MGTLNSQQLQTEVKANLGNRGDFTVATGSRTELFLNFAQDRIARAHKFKELRRFSSNSMVFNNNNNDKFLSAPGLLRTLYTITLQDGSNSHKIEFIDITRWDRNLPRPEESSRRRPVQYTFFRNIFEFHPLPDKAYTVFLRWDAWPATLTGLSQVSDFTHKDDMLIALATSYAFGSLGNDDKARSWFRIYATMFDDAKLQDVDHPHEELVPLFEIGAPTGDYWKDPFIREIL